ncbi:hypothetical protein GRX03_00415 [Halovenus sp. WSH3]|uniref:Uncharacterized protein n=1 Tax=Halovenus carboxidivorans TaxID=2692199 RepID=A0A6B0T3M6_9EURY|nr:hypothetical protein [Halovenus carboxidivorans]MXR50073.1 hypothetical protein [Halovenus carboxidivorans]
MPVVFTPYLKERLGVESHDRPRTRGRQTAETGDKRPTDTGGERAADTRTDQASAEGDGSLLTRRQLLVGVVAAVVLAVAAVRRRTQRSERP